MVSIYSKELKFEKSIPKYGWRQNDTPVVYPLTFSEDDYSYFVISYALYFLFRTKQGGYPEKLTDFVHGSFPVRIGLIFKLVDDEDLTDDDGTRGEKVEPVFYKNGQTLKALLVKISQEKFQRCQTVLKGLIKSRDEFKPFVNNLNKEHDPKKNFFFSSKLTELRDNFLENELDKSPILDDLKSHFESINPEGLWEDLENSLKLSIDNSKVDDEKKEKIFKSIKKIVDSIYLIALSHPIHCNVIYYTTTNIDYSKEDKDSLQEQSYYGLITADRIKLTDNISEENEDEFIKSYYNQLLSNTFSYSGMDGIHESKNYQEVIRSNSRKVANISILVDSFAHNVAGHSLASLSNYFANRNQLLETRTLKKNLKYHETSHTVFTEDQIKELFGSVKKEYEKLTGREIAKSDKNKISISDIIKFGNEKQRRCLFHLKQPSYGKEDVYLPIPIDDSVFSFINYLSEKSEFWSAVIEGESFNHSITTIFDLLWRFVENPLFIGTLAASEVIHKIKFVINDKKFALVDFAAINEMKLSGNYHFVELLDDFEELRDCLSKKVVWLPGNNVGKQSLYTIFENCLRNVKHYSISRNDKKHEVIFHFDIPKNDGDELYTINMYLGHEDLINKKTAGEVATDVKAQIDEGPYHPETSQPIMGGTSQSILCANHLYTGKFSNDEDIESHFKVRSDNGFVKYSIDLWKGEKIKSVKEDNHLKANIGRYKFLTISDDDTDIDSIRIEAQDVIRIVKTNETDQDKVYKEWLEQWLGTENHNLTIELIEEDGDCHSINNDGIKNITITFNHGEDELQEKLFFRNHGIFKRSVEGNWNDLKYDVKEAMLTGVYAIDNRLFNLVREKKNRNVIEKELNLYIKPETKDSLTCNEEILSISINNGIVSSISISNKIQFLIVHLSFIESLGKTYKDNITKFVEEIKNTVTDRRNFHLIITTTRGNPEWKKAINEIEEYKSLVKYRSVSSMQNALRSGVQIGDDFNLKYNFVKALFGS